MPAGLQVWDENGILILDTSIRTVRVLGSVATMYEDGSLAVDTKGGELLILSTNKHLQSNVGNGYPAVYVAGNSIVWTFGITPANWRNSFLVTYGAY